MLLNHWAKFSVIIKQFHFHQNPFKSKILIPIVNFSIMRPVLCFSGRRTNASVASSGPNYVFSLAKISPVGNSLISTSFPLLFSQDTELFDYLLCFYLIHFSLVVGLLKLCDMLLFGLDLLE